MAAGEVLFTVDDLLRLLVFLLIVWIAGRGTTSVGLPSLVGECVCGALLGPPLADWVPQPAVAGLALAGQVGLLLLVVESGLEVQASDLKDVGLRGIVVAFCGSLFGPFLLALGIGRAWGFPFREALAVGASLSPTSMGVSVLLFKQHRVLNTPLAQLVMSAAVVDDIIGLVLLSELHALAAPSPSSFILPIVSAVAFFVGVGAAALLLLPRLLARLLPRLPPARVEPTVLILLALLVLGLAAALDRGRASYLLGAFLGGLSFASLPSVHALWARQVKRIQVFLLRLFFAATIGFSIPIAHFWTGGAWALALALWAATSAAKAATGLLAKPRSASGCCMVGAAMSVRGEFAFLVANTAFADGTLSAAAHAGSTLAIFLSLLSGPASLRRVLSWRRRQMEEAVADAEHEAAAVAVRARAGGPVLRARVYYLAEIRCVGRWALVPDLLRTLGRLGVEVLDCRTAHVDGELSTIEIFLRDEKLLDSDPETAAADGLEARMSELAQALHAHLVHDVLASCEVVSPGQEAGWGAEGALPPLHGLRLQRWLPGLSEAEAGLEGREEDAAYLMSLQATASAAAPTRARLPTLASLKASMAAALAERGEAAMADGAIALAAAATEAQRARDGGGAESMAEQLQRIPSVLASRHRARSAELTAGEDGAAPDSRPRRSATAAAGGAAGEAFAAAIAEFRAGLPRTREER